MKDVSSLIVVFALASLGLSGCASLLDFPVQPETDQYESEPSRMEDYVQCVRDKKRKETDPPCLLD